MDGYLGSSSFAAAQIGKQARAQPLPLETDLTGQLALTGKQAEVAYAIRHEGYLSYGYITRRDNGLFTDRYDGRANSRVAIVYKNGVAAATVRVCLYDPGNSDLDFQMVPAMEIFRDEIVHVLQSHDPINRPARAVEITRLARHPAFMNDIDVIFALFRLVGYLILYFDADVALNACRPHHMAMYRRLGFQKLHEPRQYPNLTYAAGLMACFRMDYGEATNKLGFLRGISAKDESYRRLLAGESIQLFRGALHERPKIMLLQRHHEAHGASPSH